PPVGRGRTGRCRRALYARRDVRHQRAASPRHPLRAALRGVARALGGRRLLRLGSRHLGGDRVAAHEVLYARPFLQELGELPAGQLALARHLDGHGVHIAAVDQHLEVDVRARGQARRADIADDLALAHLDALADARGEARHVAIGGLVAVGVPDADIVAVLALASGLLDDAVAR